MRSINIENILRKHFGKVSREGLGFLESNIKAAAEELNQATVDYEKVLTLRDEDLKPGRIVVEMAIEEHEVSFNNLQVNDFTVNPKLFHTASIIVYTGKLGYQVLKYAPKNIALKPILNRLG